MMTRMYLWPWPYQVHAHLLERDPTDGKGNERCLRQLIGCCLLALWAHLTEVWHLGHHTWPVKPVLNLLQCILGPQVSFLWVSVGQVHNTVDLCAEHDEAFTGLAVVGAVVI